ncbi:MAG: UbiD family decarboxylase, partial [Candidatus Omnitrophica bacterium]|nr:UbiD family decarboxylase [Candidatus Omnitrophota bacterium]
PSSDFLLLPGVPFDTLDFTSFTLNLGSKMVLDATRNGGAPAAARGSVAESQVASLHPRIRRARLLEEALLAVQVEGEGREVIQALVKVPALSTVKLIAAVSPDVDLDDPESLLWGLFTRFDPARDVTFTSSELRGAGPPTKDFGGGAWPVHRGCLGIDATFKAGYPDPVVMDPAVVKRVDAQWGRYWKT